jgi:hypothetical protein
MIAAFLIGPLLVSPSTLGLEAVDELYKLLEAARAVPIPSLSDTDLDEWRDHLRPSPNEVGWESIPWLPSFAEGVRQADKEGKPLLFWTMNGHPLGST